MATLPLLGQAAVWSTALRFASTRGWICRRTAASTSTMARVQASVAPSLSCTVPCCLSLLFWTQGWRTALIVVGLMLCGKSGGLWPPLSPGPRELGVRGTGRSAGSTLVMLLTAAQTFACTVKRYITVRVSVPPSILILANNNNRHHLLIRPRMQACVFVPFQLAGNVVFCVRRIRRRIWCVNMCRLPVLSRCYTGARMEKPLVGCLKSSTLCCQKCLPSFLS